QVGVVVAYAIRRREGVFLFDTGFGFGDPELDAMYHPVGPLMRDVLGEAGIRIADIDLIANCHLHPDHAGQNASFPGIPIHVRAPTRPPPGAADYTTLGWVAGPAPPGIEATADHEPVPGIRVLATPGHSPGHQSLVVDQADGPVLLTGQAIYGLDE